MGVSSFQTFALNFLFNFLLWLFQKKICQLLHDSEIRNAIYAKFRKIIPFVLNNGFDQRALCEILNPLFLVNSL